MTPTPAPASLAEVAQEIHESNPWQGRIQDALERAAAIVERFAAAQGGPLQGGMTNAELLAAFKAKLPSVEPSGRDMSAFAVGVEVGFSRARAMERQDWDRVHHALAKHGAHPGRTDDHLADVIDKVLTERYGEQAAAQVSPIIAARYRNGTGPWSYTDTGLGSIEADGWNQVVYLCDAHYTAPPAAAQAERAAPVAQALAAFANARDIIATDRQSFVDCQRLGDSRIHNVIAHGLVWVDDETWIAPEDAEPLRDYDRALAKIDAATAALRAAPVDERAAFEAWFKRDYHPDSLTMEGDCYTQRGAGMAWQAWQARAALAAAPAQPGAEG